MKINCIHCGHAFALDGSYADYEGLIRCPTCGGLLDVRIQDAMVRAVRPGSLTPQSFANHAPAPHPDTNDNTANEAA
jgi:DNA-directed RNA polymerase subunit RPC12/RpoP